MMGKIETQQAGGLADVMTLHQQTFRLIYYIIMNVADGGAARCLMDNIAKVARRIGKLGGAPRNGGQTLRKLSILTEIGL